MHPYRRNCWRATTKITIDGQNGLLMSRDCGILLLAAFVIMERLQDFSLLPAPNSSIRCLRIFPPLAGPSSLPSMLAIGASAQVTW